MGYVKANMLVFYWPKMELRYLKTFDCVKCFVLACNISSGFAYKIQENKFTKNLKLNEHRKYKMEVIKMTKANAAALNDMELDMVAGGYIIVPPIRRASDDITAIPVMPIPLTDK